MSKFIQLHFLTSYAPSNLNRDDLGRPKTAKMGGFERLRVSSQSLKRNWRTSELFEQALTGKLGTRTKLLGQRIFNSLIEKGINEKLAKEWTAKIAEQFGKLKQDKKDKKENSFEIEQLAHISPIEEQNIFALVDVLVAENREPTDKELKDLKSQKTAVDIALFGRMLASSPEFNVEAACQVAHAISVHQVTVEDDYFTAIDDLNDGKVNSGSAHIGETGFAAALFYHYICINKTLLIENLAGDVELANQAIKALTEAALKVAPTGKQNSFASRAYASYVRAEIGEQQPRSLAVSFLKPIYEQDQAKGAIRALETQASYFDQVYGQCADQVYTFDVTQGQGSFEQLCEFLTTDKE